MAKSSTSGRAAYRKGSAFENAVEVALASAGWLVVRSAGSHDPVDLIAWVRGGADGARRIVAVQCRVDGVIGPNERTAAAAFCYGLTAEIYAAKRGRAGMVYVRLIHPQGRWGADAWEELEAAL